MKLQSTLERYALQLKNVPRTLVNVAVFLPVPVYQGLDRVSAINIDRHRTADLATFHNGFTVEQIGDRPAVLVDIAGRQVEQLGDASASRNAYHE